MNEEAEIVAKTLKKSVEAISEEGDGTARGDRQRRIDPTGPPSSGISETCYCYPAQLSDDDA